MEWLTDLTAYHWFALGLILFAAEALGAAGFLLGAAAGALTLGMLTLVAPELSLSAQLGVYALVSVLATVLYLKVFAEVQDDREDALHRRAAGLIGQEFDLAQPVPSGESRLQIGDTLWRVRTDRALDAGTRVRVVEADTMSLRIAAG